MKITPIPASTAITRSSSTKSVHFSPKVKVIVSLALDDFTDEEIDDVWITSREDNTSKEHIVQTLKVLRANGGSVPLDLQSNFSALGLENMASQVHIRKFQENQARHIDGVLNAQDIPLACSERIALISEVISHPMRKKAVAIAHKLATDVEK